MELAGTTAAPRSQGEVRTHMVGAGLLGGLIGGAVFKGQGQSFNPGGALLGAALGVCLAADW